MDTAGGPIIQQVDVALTTGPGDVRGIDPGSRLRNGQDIMTAMTVATGGCANQPRLKQRTAMDPADIASINPGVTS